MKSNNHQEHHLLISLIIFIILSGCVTPASQVITAKTESQSVNSSIEKTNEPFQLQVDESNWNEVIVKIGARCRVNISIPIPLEIDSKISFQSFSGITQEQLWISLQHTLAYHHFKLVTENNTSSCMRPTKNDAPPVQCKLIKIEEQQEPTKIVKKDESLFTTARIVPNFRNGKKFGFRIYSIQKDSIWENIGLKNGDVMLYFNQTSLNTPQGFMDFCAAIENNDYLTIQLSRRGKNTVIMGKKSQ